MKLKYYLRGLGTGILFATLILFISYTYHNTDAQIKKRAKELGMVETTVNTSALDNEKTSEINTTENNTTSEINITENKTTNEISTTTEIETTKDEQYTTDTNQTTTVSEENTSINEAIKTEYEFSIVSGMTSQQVASLLQSIGAIDDAIAFDSYLEENGYANRIRVGNFKISGDASYADIAILITN